MDCRGIGIECLCRRIAGYQRKVNVAEIGLVALVGQNPAGETAPEIVHVLLVRQEITRDGGVVFNMATTSLGIGCHLSGHGCHQGEAANVRIRSTHKLDSAICNWVWVSYWGIRLSRRETTLSSTGNNLKIVVLTSQSYPVHSPGLYVGQRRDTFGETTLRKGLWSSRRRNPCMTCHLILAGSQ